MVISMKPLWSLALKTLSILIGVAPLAASAQTPGTFTPYSPLLSSSLNAALAAKLDYKGASPIFPNVPNTYTAKQNYAPSSSAGAGINLSTGTAPSVPITGDEWITNAGVFFDVNGATQQMTPSTTSGITTALGYTPLRPASNLSDVSSPSTALSNLAGAPLASAALTGTPTAPTALAATSTTQIATTAFVTQGPGANLAVANCANAAGDGAIIQTAVSTGKTVHIVGPCDLDSHVTFTTPGQIIYGDGRTVTTLNVSTILTTGAFIFSTGEPGPDIRDVGFVFTQPNVSVRSGLTNYTAAIWAENTPRFKVTRMGIQNAMVGIDMTGNSGGAVINDLELSALSIGIWIDGSEDSVRLDHIHIWPIGVLSLGTNCGALSPTGVCVIWNAPNLNCTPQTTTGTAGPIGIYSGRMDDLILSNSLELIGQGLCFFTGTSAIPGVTIATISNNAADTFGGVFESGGNISFTSSYFTLLDNLHQAINVQTGSLQCSGCFFFDGNNFGGPGQPAMIDQIGGSLNLNNSYVDLGGGDMIAVRVNTAGNLIVNGLQVNSTLATHTNDIIQVDVTASGANAIISGVQPTLGITAGTLIHIGADGYHRIVGNGSNTGWANVCPGSVTHAVYANNGTSSTATCN